MALPLVPLIAGAAGRAVGGAVGKAATGRVGATLGRMAGNAAGSMAHDAVGNVLSRRQQSSGQNRGLGQNPAGYR